MSLVINFKKVFYLFLNIINIFCIMKKTITKHTIFFNSHECFNKFKYEYITYIISNNYFFKKACYCYQNNSLLSCYLKSFIQNILVFFFINT